MAVAARGAFTPVVENYSTANMADVVELNVHRWFNNCLPKDLSRVVYVIGDGATALGNLDIHDSVPTHEVISTDAQTIAASGPDHTVFVDTDTIGAAATMTISDAAGTNHRLLVVNIGANDLTLTMSGLEGDDVSVPAGEGRPYVFKPGAWFLYGGGGSGGTDLSGLQVPQPQKFVEKWNDGGAGNVTSKVNEWGTGIYLVQGINSFLLQAEEQSFIIQIEDETQSVYNAFSGSSGSDYYFGYEATTGAFQNLLGSFVYIKSVSRFEDDPDNLPLLEIPADPAVFPTWIEKYERESGGPVITEILNTWGEGLFYVGVSFTYNAETYRTNGELAVLNDGTKRISVLTADITGLNSSIELEYNISDTNEFSIIETGSDFTNLSFERIYKWETASSGDVLSEPEDGWETVFDDDTNTSDVTNIWGVGTYELTVRFSGTTAFDGYEGLCHITIKDTAKGVIATDFQISTSASSGSSAIVAFNPSTVAFEITEALTGNVYISRIRKFNGLLNVYHSYHPDPRSVAQKDWVELLDTPQTSYATVSNVWGDGKYKAVMQSSATGNTFTADIEVVRDDLASGDRSRSAVLSSSTDIYFYYDYDGVAFGNTGGYAFLSLKKYQDSLASDAPRTVLSDGWELVYENATPQTTVAMSALSEGGLGLYKFEGTCNYGINTDGSWQLEVFDLDTDNQLPGGVGGANADNYWGWDASAASFVNFQGSVLAIRKIWKFTGLLSISAQYNVTSLSDGENQVQAINTDAGDVAVTLPSSPTLGQLFEVWNTGSNGNYVQITTDGSTLYNSLEIGDKKGLKLRYVDGWKYEDVIIDEYTTTTTDFIFSITKYSGGKLRITGVELTTSSTRTVSLPEVFTDSNYSTSVSNAGTTNPIAVNACSHTSSTFEIRKWNSSGVSTAGLCRWFAEGRWKAGE